MSPASNITNASTALLLESAVQELRDRSEVQAVLTDLLTDVELASQLHTELQQEQRVREWQRQWHQCATAAAEIRAHYAQTRRDQVELADALVVELQQLSVELGQLKDVKQQHEQLLVQYDEVVAKLLQAEDNLVEESERRERMEERQQQQQKQQQQPKQEQSSATTEPSAETDQANPNDKVVVVPKPEASSLSNDARRTSTVVEVEEEEDDTERDEELDLKPAAVSESVPDTAAVLAHPTLIPSSEHAPDNDRDGDERNAVVALVEDDLDQDNEVPPRLDELDTKLLMEVFAYLDALDILNMAQINISMYSRVDALFGTGGEPGDSSTIATAESTSPTPAPAPEPVPTQQQHQHQATVASIPPAAPSTVASSSMPSTPTIVPIPSHAQPTMVALPPSTATTTPTSKPSSTPRSKTPPPQSQQQPQTQTQKHHTPTRSADFSAGGLGLFSSLLQSRNRGSQPSTPTRPYQRTNSAPATESAAATASRSLGASSGSTSTEPLSNAIAASITAKLSPAEINIIFQMNERLKQKEAQTAKLTQENAELVAKLDGTEGVKQFLIAKVREMEQSITSSVENEIKVAQQIASDQEVIAFLDARVQELEREVRQLRQQQQEAVEQLERVQQQSAQKATVLGDMLQFEREKLKDGEREWKATRKLLVKEVRSCRAQIVALQAERDGYRQQNETLHRNMIASPNNNTSSYSRDPQFFAS